MSICENSVKFYLYYEEKGYHIIIMELCDNELEKIINDKENGFNSSEILSIMSGLNNAFKYMKMNGIIHRDLKLENIMIKYNPSKTKFIPKINDYGFSRELGSGVASTFCGSLQFMAPEILLNQLYDDKSDLWSIGIMIYLLHFKKAPFEVKNYYNKKEVEKELNKKKKKNAKNKLLDDLLDKLLVYDPNKRLSWAEYFNHPFFNQNKDLIDKFENFGINDYKKDNDKIIKVYAHILEKMVIDSYVIKEINEKDIKTSPEKFISIDDCLKYKDKKDDQFFILGILAKYLEKIGIKTLIKKTINLPRNSHLIDYHKTLLQFICNGYILKNKYILNFALNDDRRTILIKDITERCKFNEKLKNVMSKKYNLKDEEIIITNYKIINNQFSAIIIFKSNFNRNITKNELIEIFQNDADLIKITSIEKELIIPSIRLDRSMLDYQGDNKDNKWRENEKRGGEPYYPPKGWIKYGIRIADCYDNKNNDWITLYHKTGEWCTAYCGITGITKKIEQIYENENDIKHPGEKIGIGVYCSIKSNIMGENTEIININGYDYKIGFMIRVKPDKIRCPESYKDIWVVNGNYDEFRPYGILLK